nr:odorant binding protein 11 [Pagiophloeus tsushimanus]
MNSSVILLVILGAFYAVNADLTDEQKQKIQAYGKECVGETSVDTELIKKARAGTFTDDAKLKAFVLCMSKKLGFQNNNGEIQTEVVRQKLGGALNDADAANKLVEKCLVVKGSNEDTAFESFKCYYESTPTHLTVF